MPGFPDAMPLHGLVGELMIGLAAALMLLANGRVAGCSCSGLFARAVGLAAEGAPRGIALAFVIGLPVGAALFGIGWGVAGLRPGPAIAALAVAPVPAFLFYAGMVAGFTLFRLLPAIPSTRKNATWPSNGSMTSSRSRRRST